MTHVAATAHSYDVVAPDYADLLADITAVEQAADLDMIREFARVAASLTGQIADFGCGPGRMTAFLQSLGLNAFGIDVSPGMVSVARQRHPNLDFLVGDINRLGLADASVAGALSWYSVIHTPPEELDTVAAEFARVLLPTAPLLVAFQCGDGERVDRLMAYGHHAPLTNYRHDVDHVAAVLANAGFDEVQRLIRAPAGRETSGQAFILAGASRVTPRF